MGNENQNNFVLINYMKPPVQNKMKYAQRNPFSMNNNLNRKKVFQDN